MEQSNVSGRLEGDRSVKTATVTAKREVANKKLSRSLPWNMPAGMWTIQGYGLMILIFLSFFPRLSHVGEYLFLTLVLAAVTAAWLEGKKIFVPTPIDLPLLLFAGWVLLTVPFATDPAYSFAEWRKLATKILAFYWAFRVLQAQPSRTMARGVLTAVQIGTAVLCIYAIAEFVARGGGWEDRYVRAAAPSSDYNWLSTYLVMVIPLVALAGVALRAWWQRAACAAIVCLAVLAQVLSYTRAGWLGLVAEGLAFGLLTGRRQVVAWVLGGCLLVTGGLLAVSQLGYQRSTVDPWTFNARLAVWKLEVAEVLAHPLVGVGYGGNTFMMRFADYPETKYAGGPHSAFLMVAMGSGLPALVFLTWTLVSAIRVLVRHAKQIADRYAYAITLAAAIMIVGFATRNIFDYMFAGSLAYLFWMLLATGLAENPAHSGIEKSRTLANETGVGDTGR